MAQLPMVADEAFVKRTGILHLRRVVNDARCVRRELEHRDLGVDGHIEYVNADGLAPGRLVAVQVKSGESRFTNANASHVPFHPTKRGTTGLHIQYRVILVLHNPATLETPF